MSERFDIVVVGAGNAGIPAAIEAGARGARVLLVEKDVRIGGTPALHRRPHVRRGHEDPGPPRHRGLASSAHLADIERITHGTHRAGPRRARRHARRRRPIDWLDEHGFRFDAATPRIVHGHEPYSVPRSYYGPDGGLSILETLKPLLAGAGRRRARSRSGPTPPSSGCSPTHDDPLTLRGVLVLHRGVDVEVEADCGDPRHRRVRERQGAVRGARGRAAGLGRAPDRDRRRPDHGARTRRRAAGRRGQVPARVRRPAPPDDARPRAVGGPPDRRDRGTAAVGDLRRPRRAALGAPRTSRRSTRRNARSPSCPTSRSSSCSTTSPSTSRCRWS